MKKNREKHKYYALTKKIINYNRLTNKRKRRQKHAMAVSMDLGAMTRSIKHPRMRMIVTIKEKLGLIKRKPDPID